MQNQPEETRTETITEEQMEEEAGEMTPLLEKVLEKTLSVFDPIEVKDHAGNIVEVTKEQFIKYYMPRNASEEEKFHCYQAVRATGLSLFAPGECYFFKTGDGPIKLFTGYMAYLRKAYGAGLEHIESPVIDFGDDPTGYPLSCTITIHIKDRESMAWPTYFAEVAGKKGESLNSRWKKAPIQMLIKCAIVNILRISGLVDFTMPYTIDEMPDPIVTGYRTLTQDQLDSHDVETEQGEASLGKVDAANHQIDMDGWRRKYHATAKHIFSSPEQRKAWQAEKIGKASSGDFEHDDYLLAFGEMANGNAAEWVADLTRPDAGTEAEGEQEDPQEGFIPFDEYVNDYNMKLCETFEDIPDRDKFEIEIGGRVATGDAEHHPWLRADYEKGLAALQETLKADPQEPSGPKPEEAERMFYTEANKRFKTIADMSAWCKSIISEKPYDKWDVAEFQMALPVLMEVPLLEDQKGQDDTKESTQPDNDVGDYGMLITPETKEKINAALLDFPGLKYKTIRSLAFRTMAFKAIGHEYTEYIKILNSDGRLILAALAEEKSEILLAKVTSEPPLDDKGEPVVVDEVVAGEMVDEDPLGVNPVEGEQSGKITDEQLAEINDKVLYMPSRFHATTASVSFRDFAKGITKRPWFGLIDLTNAEAQEVIEKMTEEVNKETAKQGETEEVKMDLAGQEIKDE